MNSQSVFSDTSLREIAWQAQTVDERVTVYEENNLKFTMDEEQEISEEFVTEWRESVFDGGDVQFEERLARMGVGEKVCQHLIEREQWPSGTELPGWIHDLERFVTFVTEANPPLEHPLGDEQQFCHVLQPWVDFGVEQLRKSIPLTLFSERAMQSARQWLLSRLSQIADEPLYVEFRTYTALQNPELLSSNRSSLSREAYNDYVQYVCSNEGIRSVFTQFPVLPRFIMLTIQQWMNVIEEFHSHLERDWERLQEIFAKDEWPEKIRDMTILTTDRHNGGHAVFQVDVTESVSLVYKPRSVNYEREFYTVVEHVSDLTSIDFDTPTVLSRGEYGWVEYKPHSECKTERQVSNYYNRSGFLIALTYLLQFSDCHYENVIAHGEFPLIVDAETILHPPESNVRTDPVLHEELTETVLWTDYLPVNRAQGEVDDVTIAGIDQPTLTVGVRNSSTTWEHVNTDRMAIREQEKDLEPIDQPDNVPVLDGDLQLPSNYLDDILSGFDSVVSIVTSETESLFSPEIKKRLAELSPRFLSRATRVYSSILYSITSLETLEDGSKITLRCDELIADELADGSTEQDWKMYEAERAAMVHLDIPRFNVNQNGNIVTPDGRRISGVVKSKPAKFLSRPDNVDRSDLLKQREYIQTTLRPADSPTHAQSISRCKDISDEFEPEPESLEDGARLIYNWIVREGCDVKDSPSWLIRGVTQRSNLDIHVSDNGLYRGRAGIALFCALLAARTGDKSPRETALRAIEPLRGDSDKIFGEATPTLGNGNGLGSRVYALSSVGQLLDEPPLVDEAVRIGTRISDEDIIQDDTFDVLGGVAGLLLSILKLYTLRRDDRLLETAVSCGDHLLRNRVRTDEGYAVWDTGIGAKPLVGFAHGTAGISYALYRLYDHTGDERFRDGAREGLAYERAVFSPEANNWPDFRSNVDQYHDRWCHGRAGIGLARAGTLAIEDDDLVRSELLTGAQNISTNTETQTDQLCCGTAGTIDFLLKSGTATERQLFANQAEKMAKNLFKCLSTNAGLDLPSHGSQLFNPTLFQGVAGVGYAFLRASNPSETPCILLWE